jgi:hypothetical protein
MREAIATDTVVHNKNKNKTKKNKKKQKKKEKKEKERIKKKKEKNLRGKYLNPIEISSLCISNNKHK